MRGARMRQRRTLDRRTLLSGTVAAAGAATVAGCGQIFAEAEIKEPDPSHTRFVMTVWGGERSEERRVGRECRCGGCGEHGRRRGQGVQSTSVGNARKGN